MRWKRRKSKGNVSKEENKKSSKNSPKNLVVEQKQKKNQNFNEREIFLNVILMHWIKYEKSVMSYIHT